MNPLDWQGPGFLSLYVPLLAGGFPQIMNGQELALAVGLFGPAMLVPLGYGWRRQLAHRIDQETGLGFVEILAEHLNPTTPLPAPLMRLQERGVPVVLHGVSLGLGGAEPPDARRLDTLARLAERLGAVCVSEHVAFVRADGIESGHLLPVPRGDEALDLLAENADRQARPRAGPAGA
jgi:uncharacterized protein (UPF0276 family)